MKSKQIFFFASKEDLIELIKFIELKFNIEYTQAGLLDRKVSKVSSVSVIEDCKEVEYGDWNFNKIYIILPKGKELKIREVPQRSGGIKYAIDQINNEESIEMYVGGSYKEKTIIASKISTISNTEFSKHTMKSLSIYFKNFKKVEDFYICPSALKEYKNGVRLTTDVRYDINYLKI